MDTPTTAETSSSKPLHLLLSQLFFHFIPTVFLGILSLVLTEAARLINHAAYLCQTPSQHKPPSQTTSPLTEPNNSSSIATFPVPPTPPTLPHPLSLTLSPTICSPCPPPPPPPLQFGAPHPRSISPPPPPPSSPPPSSPRLTSPPLSPPLSPTHSHPRSPPRSPLPSPPASPTPPDTQNLQSLSSPYYQSSSLHVSVSSAPTSPPPAPTPPRPIPPPPYSPFHSRTVSVSTQTTPPLSPLPQTPHPAPSTPLSQSPQHPPLPASTLVAKRVFDYEHFIADASANLDHPIRLPFPSENQNPPIHETPPIPPAELSITSQSTKTPRSHHPVSDREIESESRSETHRGQTCDLGSGSESGSESESESESVSQSDSCSESDTHVSEPPVLQPSGQSGDIQTFIAPTDTSSTDDTQISTPEAPAGRESLQELIPEGVPPSYPLISIDDSDVIQVDDSIGKMSPLLLSRNASITSLRTESYSSPDSQSHSNSYRNRKSWHGSDHDLFSEEPIMTFESIEEFNAGAQDMEVASVSSLGNDNFGHRGEKDLLSNQSNSKSVNKRRSFSFEEDIEIAEPIPTHMGDYPPHDLGNEGVKDNRNNSKHIRTRLIPDSKLFRQASVDLPSINTATFLVDRPRPGSAEPARFLPNRFAGLRFSRTPSVDYTPTRAAGFSPGPRSQSSAETHFDDWPEYTPSGEEDEGSPALSRRHASDMSYGVKARRQDMLPVELLDDPGAEHHILHEGDSIFDKLGAKAWKRRFVRHSLKKDDAKGMMRNILRRKRKISGLNENEPAFMTRSESYRGGERTNRLSGREGEFTFESELDQSTVFSLLERICSECGYRVVVRRPNHKVKIEVPCEDDGRGMLLSISLARVTNGQNTVVTICRSRDDLSDGCRETLEVAGSLLQKRLAGQVEFIEDSFASLDFDESTIDVADQTARSE